MSQSGVGVDTAGPPGAATIVFVHGSVVTRKMWLPQLRDLSDAYRVIAPDLPGHGALSHVPFTFAACVDRLADLIRREATGGRAVVAGLSLGGYVAIDLAAEHPDLVAGLVLSGSSVNLTGALGMYLRLVAALMRWGWLRQSREQAERKTRRLFSPALADVAETQLQAGVFPESLAPAFAGMAGRDFAVRLQNYAGPVLILNGEHDRRSRQGETRFAASLRQGRIQSIPGARHACSLDSPQDYNRAVREFAASIR